MNPSDAALLSPLMLQQSIDTDNRKATYLGMYVHSIQHSGFVSYTLLDGCTDMACQ